MEAAGRTWVFGTTEVRADERRLLVDGVPAPVSARAFDLLVYLIEHSDRVIGKDELLQQVWPGVVVEESNLTVHVASLRKLVGREVVATISGRGYRFTGQLAHARPPAPTVAGRAGAAGPAAAGDQPSLAVLPFANLCGDASQDYFVDGLVDELTSALSRVRRFFVIARSSAFTYKGRVVDVPQVGRELGVRYVVEGSVRQDGPRLRIGVQLVETGAGRHLWSQRFEGSREDIFTLQDQISEQVVAAIEPNLVLAEVERARARPTDSLHAYELCLQALPLVSVHGTKEDAWRAVELARRAIAADPAYSHAKALYAWAHTMGFSNAWMGRQRAPGALAFAREAARDHRGDPTTLAFAGHALGYTWQQLDEAVRALDLALALNPNSMTALRSSGWVRTYVCEPEVAIAHFQRAMRLNPLDPEIGYVLSGLSFAHLIAGRGPEALAYARRALLEVPTFLPGQWALLHALMLCGLRGEAAEWGAMLRARQPSLTVTQFRDAQPYTDPAYIARLLRDVEALGFPP